MLVALGPPKTAKLKDTARVHPSPNWNRDDGREVKRRNFGTARDRLPQHCGFKGRIISNSPDDQPVVQDVDEDSAKRENHRKGRQVRKCEERVMALEKAGIQLVFEKRPKMRLYSGILIASSRHLSAIIYHIISHASALTPASVVEAVLSEVVGGNIRHPYGLRGSGDNHFTSRLIETGGKGIHEGSMHTEAQNYLNTCVRGDTAKTAIGVIYARVIELAPPMTLDPCNQPMQTVDFKFSTGTVIKRNLSDLLDPRPNASGLVGGQAPTHPAFHPMGALKHGKNEQQRCILGNVVSPFESSPINHAPAGMLHSHHENPSLLPVTSNLFIRFGGGPSSTSRSSANATFSAFFVGPSPGSQSENTTNNQERVWQTC
ncbi:hypothetical protein B0H13DRAFT_1884569 [Mycena leptocephala]|nr:hypothetical protein B0H13DRAFT_1884569 [Mycena leptocephala]